MVERRLKAKYELCFSTLKCNKIGAAYVIKCLIAKKTSRNNVFKRIQTTNKVLPNLFRGLEVRKKVRLIF